MDESTVIKNLEVENETLRTNLIERHKELNEVKDKAFLYKYENEKLEKRIDKLLDINLAIAKACGGKDE